MVFVKNGIIIELLNYKHDFLKPVYKIPIRSYMVTGSHDCQWRAVHTHTYILLYLSVHNYIDYVNGCNTRIISYYI